MSGITRKYTGSNCRCLHASLQPEYPARQANKQADRSKSPRAEPNRREPKLSGYPIETGFEIPLASQSDYLIRHLPLPEEQKRRN